MRGRGFLTGLLCWLQLRPASAASTARVVEPGEMDEVCQGDTIVLRCPPPSTVLFGDPSEIQWGRNGIWENKTACGKADVSDCNTTDVKESLSNHCQGKPAKYPELFLANLFCFQKFNQKYVMYVWSRCTACHLVILMKTQGEKTKTQEFPIQKTRNTSIF